MNISKKLRFSINLIFLCILCFFVSIFFKNHNYCHAAENKKIIVGIDVNFPPMGFLDESGNVTGADIEFMKLACQQMNLDVVFQPINWDAKEMELNSGRIDAICNGLTYTPERDKSMLLTRPYMENGQVVVVKKDSSVHNLSQLKGKLLSVQQGSSGEEALNDSSLKNLVGSVVKLESCTDCLNEVKQGKVEGAVVDESVANYYLTKSDNSSKLKILNESIAKEQYVVAVKKENHNLKNKIEQAFEKMTKLEQTKQICNKWFGKQTFLFGSIQSQSNDDISSLNEKNQKNNTLAILSSGALITLQIFVFCLLFSVPLGLILCLVRRINFKPLTYIINFYIALMRGTPLLLQLFFVFYGLPIIFPGLILKNRLLVSIVTFVLNYSAYFSEIFRGGLNSIGIGQFENIKLLQISKTKATFKIVVPQMLKVCLPSICNETITLIKDTPLSFAVGVMDFLTAAKNLVNTTADVSIYGIVALVYLLASGLIILIFNLFEKNLTVLI